MKTIIQNKLVMVLIALIFAFASAQNSVSVSIAGETRVDGVGGTESGKASFLEGGSYMDGFSVTFKSVIDNVTAQVVINDSDDAGGGLKFDSAYIEVADLFDGLLTFKFFDIGYGAGSGYSIRPDIGSHGVKVTVKPIDMLSISLGYGVATKDFYNLQNVEWDALGDQTNIVKRDYHAIQLDVGINNAFVPTTIYGGVILIDGGELSGLKMGKNPAALGARFLQGDDSQLEKVGIYHASAGVSLDVLAFLLPGAVNLDVGAVFPLMGAATYTRTDMTTEGDYENELNLAGVLHGSISDLGVEGLGLGYSVAFALDTSTKQQTLGDLDADDDDNFKELVKVSITPSYTIGQFTIALNGIFGMVGENHAIASGAYTEAYNHFEATPSVKWAPASGTSVEGYFKYYDGNMSDDASGVMRLGLKYNASFGVEGL